MLKPSRPDADPRIVEDWFENDELFIRELTEGHQYAHLVADLLTCRGLAVELTPMIVRSSIEARRDFADEYDIKVGERRPAIIDVKSRRLRFTGHADYPYPTALVDTVSGWSAKTHRPDAIVLVSRETHGLAVIPTTRTESSWTTVHRFDRVRGIVDCFYEIDRRLLRSFADLVAWLQERERCAVQTAATMR